jgi:cytochrome c oxidase subunit II
VGLQLPKRMPLPQRTHWRRAGLALVTTATLLTMSGCSIDKEELKRLGQPVISKGATNHTASQYDLWLWSWVAAMITGVLVWGLIGYAVVKFRRRDDQEIPIQTRYNLPLEILYTLAPVVMVLVFFYFTVNQQNTLTHKVAKPDHVVDVVGQQWSWTFNYTADDALDGKTTVFQPGDPANPPTLYLVEGESVRFRLHSPDVVHDFWVPGFLQKMDVVPGVVNSFDLTPTRAGTYAGKCAELCGVYHSRMLFRVEVVDKATFASKLKELQARGNIGPACGGSNAHTIAGLEGDAATSTGALDQNGACK